MSGLLLAVAKIYSFAMSAFHSQAIHAGIAVSNDPVLQTRVLAYADTQRYRLGVNYQLLPVSFAHAMSLRSHSYVALVLVVLETNETMLAKWKRLLEVCRTLCNV